MSGILSELFANLSELAWGPWTVVLMMGAGIVLSCRTRFFQIRRLGLWMRSTAGGMLGGKGKRSSSDKGAISQLQSLTVALAGTLGTGNIVGVAVALSCGGAGAIFWMWVAAFFGMMTDFSENVLGIIYRRRNERGEWLGGPMLYMERGLGSKGLACFFAGCCLLTSFAMGNLLQINAVAAAAESSLGLPRIFCGIAVAAAVGAVLLGGLKRAADFTVKLIPALTIAYIAACVIVIGANLGELPRAFSAIFSSAFTPGAAGGGILGAALVGVKRGVSSNEAGLGGSVIVHSCADVDHPVKQGMWGIFEVFADTMLTCTLTALAVLTSGVLRDGKLTDGSLLSAAAFGTVFGSAGEVFLTVSLALFAFSTMLGWSCYGEKCVSYLFGCRRVKWYRLAFIASTVVGSVLNVSLAFDVSDILCALMSVPNLTAVLLLSGDVQRETRGFEAREENRPALSVRREKNSA